MEKADKIWMNGSLVPWDEARIHVLSHVVHYGSAVFEGIRCYRPSSGSAIFRLKEHVARLFDSAKVYRMPVPYSRAQLSEAILETVRANNLESCYIRPLIYRGYAELGVNPTPCPVEVSIAVWKWGSYLGKEALEQGVDVQVSSWTRPASNSLPSEAKAAGNYLGAQLVKMEAVANGFTEGITLDHQGFVAEGSGENLFMVRNGKLTTPPLYSSILAGITRDSVLTLAQDLGIPVEQRSVQRGELYLAEELFFTGTAAEISPIRTVDRMPVGSGKRGPVTQKLQQAFFAILEGKQPDTHGWLTPLKPR
ncbi:MAG: branched-chain amino acid transaminase [Acidobacteria bacterium]|nr:branched-chain amino acid transaminase [Acidobacteriota bacterium]